MNLFSAGDFIPHEHCYLWPPTLVWLHVVADSLTALAYYAIPVSLLYFARQRQDLPFKWVFWLFGAFIVACGTTHLMDVWTLWHPTDWVAGGLKALTALLSVATAVTLFRLLPAALAIPSTDQLEATNCLLQREIEQHKRTETDLRQRKASLREAAVRLQALSQRLTLALQSGAIGTWDWDLTTNSLTWDERMYALYGLTPDQFTHIYEGWAQSLHPDDRAATEAAIQQALRGEQDYNPEFRVIHPDGSVRHLKAHAVVQRQAQGEPQRMIGINYDITPRKQAAEHLQALSQRLTLALKSGAIGTWRWDVVHDALSWDDRLHELYGTDPQTFRGRHSEWASRLHPDDLAVTEAAIQQALMGGQDYEAEFRIVRPDGTLRFLKSHGLVERDAAGRPLCLVGINYDITERKQAEDTIRAALKEKAVLLQEIHHRVKNNLQIVYSLLRLQWRQLKDKQAAAALWESQNRIAVIALVHEKLYRANDLTRINAQEYISSLVSNLVSTFTASPNQVEVQLEVDPLALAIDQAIPCGLIINELVSNALKYAFPNQEPGRLTVQFYATAIAPEVARAAGICTCPAIECGHQQITLVVADNGVGLPDTVPIGAAANTLGLQLVADFTDQLQGTLEVGSQQINGQHGTHIRVLFPAPIEG